MPIMLSVSDAATVLRDKYRADVTARDLSNGLYTRRFKGVQTIKSSAGHLIAADDLIAIALELRRAGKIPADVQII
jgi:hypothetical protein